MSSNTARWGQNGVKATHINPLRPSSVQQDGGRKGLLHRLKTDTPHKKHVRESDDAVQKEPRYVDVTAAFFGRHRRQAPRSQSPAPPKQVQLHQGPPPLVVQLQQEKPRTSPVAMQAPGLPLAIELKSELDQSIATEGSQLYRNGSERLNELYESLKGAMADTAAENDRVLALVDSQHKKIAKPLSETRLRESSTDESGKATLRQEIHIGKQVKSFREHMRTLGAEVDHLWEAWEAAEREVQKILASLTRGGDDDPVGQADPVVKARKSLARDMQNFEEELENILRESHQEASVSEKEFSKKINGVMSALLQQYLLGD
ncbi:hypothetical protein VPNG_07700 [Cytospora leucostoma]|uniref:Uncharacterized protein n=1 Tax=Cytospora leucostoma TaxID=1230097 RepID=A0A423W8D2_9PEZI|nr:hypothetical protein VPNG_07700 [Cytospora leucostoma]